MAYLNLTKHGKLAEAHLRYAGLQETFIMESGDVLEVDRFAQLPQGGKELWAACIDSGSVDVVGEVMVIRDRRHLGRRDRCRLSPSTGIAGGLSLPEIVSPWIRRGRGAEFIGARWWLGGVQTD